MKKNEKKSVKRNTREERVERQSKGNIYEEKDRDRDKERQSVVFSATFGCSCDIIISNGNINLSEKTVNLSYRLVKRRKFT